MSTITASLPPSPVPAAPAAPAGAARAAVRGAMGTGDRQVPPPSSDTTPEESGTGTLTGDDRGDPTPATSRTAKSGGSRAARRDVNDRPDDALSTPEGGNFATLLATFLPVDPAPTLINNTETAAPLGAAGSTGSAPLAPSAMAESSDDAGAIDGNVPSGLAEVRASLPTAIPGSPLATRQGRTTATTPAAPASTETSSTAADASTLATVAAAITTEAATAASSSTAALATSAAETSADATAGSASALPAVDATAAATSAPSGPAADPAARAATTEHTHDTGDRVTRSDLDTSGGVTDRSADNDAAPARTAQGAETAAARSSDDGAGDAIRAAAHEIIRDAQVDRAIGTRADDPRPYASAIAEAAVARAHASDDDAAAASDASVVASVANAPTSTPVSVMVNAESPVEGRPVEPRDGDDGDADTNATSITDAAAALSDAAPTRPTKPAHAASERTTTRDDAPSSVPLMASVGAAASQRAVGADSEQRQDEGPVPTVGVATAARVAERSTTESAKADAPAAAPVPTTTSLVNDQLVSAARRFKDRDGTHRLHLDLHPAELGAVTIDVTVEGATVHLHMSAERASTSELLRSALDELRASLNDGGFTAGQLDVGQRGSGRQQQASAFERLVPEAVRRDGAANATTAVARATTRRTPSDGSRLDLQL